MSPRKATEHLRKHGVDFAEVIALEDDYALTIADPNHHEQRFKDSGNGALSEYPVCSSLRRF